MCVSRIKRFYAWFTHIIYIPGYKIQNRFFYKSDLLNQNWEEGVDADLEKYMTVEDDLENPSCRGALLKWPPTVFDVGISSPVLSIHK